MTLTYAALHFLPSPSFPNFYSPHIAEQGFTEVQVSFLFYWKDGWFGGWRVHGTPIEELLASWLVLGHDVRMRRQIKVFTSINKIKAKSEEVYRSY